MRKHPLPLFVVDNRAGGSLHGLSNGQIGEEVNNCALQQPDTSLTLTGPRAPLTILVQILEETDVEV